MLLLHNVFFCRKIIKSHHKDDADNVDEKKKYYDESHKIKHEDSSKADDVNKTEIKLKSSKPNNLNQSFENDLKDEISSKSNKVCVDNSKEDNVKKKFETLKLDCSENKTSGSSKYNKSHEDKESIVAGDGDYNKKHRFDADKKFAYSKRIDNRRQDSKVDRRIRNKDRPAIEIYRPGMGRLSKLKAENDFVESESKT